MSFLLAFTVYVLNKMLTTKKNSYELAKAKKEQAKRKKMKKQQKVLKKKKVEHKTAVDDLVSLHAELHQYTGSLAKTDTNDRTFLVDSS